MKKIIKLLMVIALVAFINPMICYADVQGDNKGLFRADYSITVTDKMEGSGFVAGNTVNINNEVDGILFGAGNFVNISSKSDHLFAAGNSVNINESTFNDGFVAGQIIEINDVNASRDLYVAGQKIKVTGNVGRNLFIAGTDVVIDGVINGNVYVDATTITINSYTDIKGNLKYNDDTEITISKDANIGSKTTYKSNSNSYNVDGKQAILSVFASKLLDTVLGLLNILVVGFLMALLIPSLFNKLKEIAPNRLLPSFAWGLLILVAVPVIALIAMITYIGVSAGFVALAIYGVLVYISSIISVYTITSMILKDKVKNTYLVLLIGLACLYVIKLIPFIGGLVSFAVLCLGLGLLTNLIKRK